ncbi:hypothetical protein [Scleromatobacter humisilvae]|uniref:Uncharacterized protein n=1 Tax=Scleromatobacter humisilvae TaxID=2897159 RepID=A0A9X1YLF5_9BURK|nr:hypothetical protein [Scleromatobacter humisilvae]MCK9687055.1 hypothetical protein [Scleromatobacter humisilvae]
MNNQDIDGNVPPEAPATPPAAPDSLEQQLEKEREARALMRDRLRNTEALAAESHALRARMAEELERVTADRDRLRAEAASGAPSAAASGESVIKPKPAPSRVTEPLYTPTMSAVPPPHAADRPLKPPTRAARKGPWAALAMLSVLAVAVAGAAWYKGTLPGGRDAQVAATPAATSPVDVASSQTAASPQPVAATTPSPSAAVATAAPSSGAVPLPPLAPEAQLAAAPTAAGPAAPADASGLPARLRKALDGEGIASSVDVDAATGHVRVSDAQNDDALRQRTDMVVRAVYAGASLPEPQIEHRWLSPMRAHETIAAADTSTPAPRAEPARPEHRKATTTAVAVAAVDALTPVLPAGRVTESCMRDLAGKATMHRANMTACMKRSCCSSAANHNSEECRAYDKAYPFTCGAG